MQRPNFFVRGEDQIFVKTDTIIEENNGPFITQNIPMITDSGNLTIGYRVSSNFVEVFFAGSLTPSEDSSSLLSIGLLPLAVRSLVEIHAPGVSISSNGPFPIFFEITDRLKIFDSSLTGQFLQGVSYSFASEVIKYPF